MESPYTIASLPRPLDNVHGETHVARVFGLRGSKKRKRHEVAVAVDGESLNIYDVRLSSSQIIYSNIADNL